MTAAEQIETKDDIALLLAEAVATTGVVAAYLDRLDNIGTNLPSCVSGIGHMVEIARLRLLEL